jgi:hypothetical protein
MNSSSSSSGVELRCGDFLCQRSRLCMGQRAIHRQNSLSELQYAATDAEIDAAASSSHDRCHHVQVLFSQQCLQTGIYQADQTKAAALITYAWLDAAASSRQDCFHFIQPLLMLLAVCARQLAH